MQSQNFEFLRQKHPELSSLGGFAEAYARPDPSSALVKLRTMAEYVVGYVYVTWRLPRPYNGNLNDLLNETAFRSAVPEFVQTKLHLLRKQGDEAAHGSQVTPQLALARLKEAFDVASWIFLRFDGGQRAQLPAYREPAALQANDTDKEALQKEKKAALDKLAAQEAQLQKLLTDLDARNQALAVAEQAASVSKEALATLLAEGQKAANTLQLDELMTRRRIIDEDLLAAGWSVGPGGASTDQVEGRRDPAQA
jgi:type I restriction enzyme R subunit